MSDIVKLTTDSKGFNYSTEQFEGYKFRGVFDLRYFDEYERRKTQAITIYTTNPSKEETREMLFTKASKTVYGISTIIWKSNDADKAESEFVDSIVK